MTTSCTTIAACASGVGIADLRDFVEAKAGNSLNEAPMALTLAERRRLLLGSSEIWRVDLFSLAT